MTINLDIVTNPTDEWWREFNHATACYVDDLYRDITSSCSVGAMDIVGAWWNGASLWRDGQWTPEYADNPHRDEAHGVILTLISNGLG